jgi:hypothetical protein
MQANALRKTLKTQASEIGHGRPPETMKGVAAAGGGNNEAPTMSPSTSTSTSP